MDMLGEVEQKMLQARDISHDYISSVSVQNC